MKENLLKLIYKVEEDAEEILQEARLQAQNLKSQAASASKQIISEKESKAKAEGEGLREEERRRTEKILAEKKKQHQTESTKLIEKAHNRLDEAVNLVLARLEGK